MALGGQEHAIGQELVATQASATELGAESTEPGLPAQSS
jgi:hypothetical protein